MPFQHLLNRMLEEINRLVYNDIIIGIDNQKDGRIQPDIQRLMQIEITMSLQSCCQISIADLRYVERNRRPPSRAQIFLRRCL